MARLKTLKLPKGVEIDEVSNDNFFQKPSDKAIPTTLAVKDHLNDYVKSEIDKHDQAFWPDGLYRNAIINGNFDIWQRGTSFACSTITYTADRWVGYRGVHTAGLTISQQTGSDIAGAQYCIRVQRDLGNSSTQYIFLRQYMEGSRRLRGQTLTLTFRARKGADYSSASDLLTAVLGYDTATEDGRGEGGEILTNSVTLTSDWQEFTLTSTSPVPAGALSMSVRFQYNPVGTAGEADYFEVERVQLNIGDKPLPFAPRSYAEELALCQRYCLELGGDPSEVFGHGFVAASESARAILSFPVTMRVAPTLQSLGQFQLYTPSGNLAVSSINIITASKNLVNLQVVVAGATAKDPCILRDDGSGTARIILSAEL